jgi:hypothetical protein
MACRVSELVLRCRDPEVLARFWCEVLDFMVLKRYEDGSVVAIGPREGWGGSQPAIILIRGDEPEQGKSRLHIDVNPTDRDQDAELERLLKLERVRPTSARPARSPGTFSLTRKAMSSAFSRTASMPSREACPGGQASARGSPGEGEAGQAGCRGGGDGEGGKGARVARQLADEQGEDSEVRGRDAEARHGGAGGGNGRAFG